MALAQDNVAMALRELQGVLEHVAGGGSLDGTDAPRLIELTCYRALAQAGDARADAWLARAYEALQAQALRIADAAIRRGFLHNIPHHREIAAAWSTRHEGSR